VSIRLVLADDHPFILDALEGLFRLEDDIEIAARCTDGLQAIEAVTTLAPDILILDMRMPGADGVAVLRALEERGTRTRVVLLAAAVTDLELVECLRLGVRGVVLKEMAPSMLVQCVRKVYAGDVWVEKRSMSQAVDLMLRREAGGGGGGGGGPPRPAGVSWPAISRRGRLR
jgi:DNA-binding NarL/FixJ family response regulator